MARDNLDGPPPPPPWRKRRLHPCGKKHHWVWVKFSLDGTKDVYRCKFCGKVKEI